MNVLPKINRLYNFQGYYKRCVSTCCENIILPKCGFLSLFIMSEKDEMKCRDVKHYLALV